MRIAVCIKQVPDPQAPAASFYVDEAANEPRWSPPAEELVSTFDLHAIEAAAVIKEQTGAHVSVLCLGGPAVEKGLRRALAGGGDEAVRVDAAAVPGGDRAAVAAALAAAVRKLGEVDLVLCGRIAADWDMGHVPGMLAEYLGFALVTPVRAFAIAGTTARVERVTDDGFEVLEVDLPAVLAVSNEVNEPRYPTMRAVLDAQRKPVATWTAADLGLAPVPGPLVTLKRLSPAGFGRECEVIDGGSPEESGTLLAGVLHAQGLA